MKFLKVAIVDDDLEDLSAAIDYVTNYIFKNHNELSYNLKVKSYQQAADFIKSFETERYDLIILDICMKDIDGIKLARLIRVKDRDCHIIFLTSSDEFLLDGYSVFASGYFIKPLSEHEEEFNNTFNYIYPKLLEKNQEITVSVTKSMDITIPYKNICFIDINENHKLRITTINQELITTMSYQKCQQLLLGDKRFLECHYRIIINMDYIQSMQSDDFILSNGTKIPISQRKRKEAKRRYMQYLAHKDD